MKLEQQQAKMGKSPQTGQDAEQARLAKLWQTWFKDRDAEARNDLLMQYIGLVRRVVSRLFPASRPYHDQEDLISCGVLGLMDAIERFDPVKGAKFETYAQIRIRGEIIDYMRHQDWAPVHVRTRIRRVESAYDEIAQAKGREASDLEVAEYMEMTVEELQQVMGDAHFLSILHLDELLNSPGAETSLVDSDAPFDRQVENREMLQILLDELSSLSGREQLILNLYYYDELTLKEIGTVVGLTESRISQIHSAALLKLRSRIGRMTRLPSVT